MQETLAKSLGLTEEAWKVYVATLELGTARVSDIAEKSGMNRTATYAILERLDIEGIVYVHTLNDKLHYEAADPDELASLVRRRLERIERSLPALKAIDNKHTVAPAVRYFTGIYEAKNLIDIEHGDDPDAIDIFDTNLSRSHHWQELRDYAQETVRSMKGSNVRIISYPGEFDISKYRKKPLFRMLIAPYFQMPAVIKVYGHKVHIFSFQDPIFALEIEHREVATAMKSLFEYCWQTLPKK